MQITNNNSFRILKVITFHFNVLSNKNNNVVLKLSGAYRYTNDGNDYIT